MAENNVIKSKRDAAVERLKSRYPDKKFEDDEEIFGAIGDDYDNYDKELDGYRDREKRLTDLFAQNPQSAQFLTDWAKGEDPVLSLIRNHGLEISEAINDPERQEQIAEANKEFVERVAKNKQLEEEYNANLSESLSLLERLQKERGLSDDEIDKAMDLLLQIINEGILGKFTMGTIDMALKALNHDSDVAVASEEAEIRGRNAKIEEKLRRSQTGDGMPVIGGRNGSSEAPRKQKSVFDLANEA